MIPRNLLRLCTRNNWLLARRPGHLISCKPRTLGTSSSNLYRLAVSSYSPDQSCMVFVRRFSGWAVPAMPARSRRQSELSNEQPNNSIQDQLYDLDMNVRRNGRILSRDLNALLSDLDSKKVQLTSNQLLFLIRCCGSLLSEETPSARRVLTQRLWNKYSANNRIDISHYNALLKVMHENEEDYDVKKFLDEIQAKGLEPNRVTYQRLLDRYCRVGDIESASQILATMKDKSIPINEAVFNSLITGYGRSGDLDSANGTLDVMRSAGLDPSNATYSALASAYAEVGNTARVIQLLDEAESTEVALNDVDSFAVVKALARAEGDVSAAVGQVLSRIKKVMGYNQEALRTVQELINGGHVDTALQVARSMDTNRDLEGRNTGVFIARQLVRAGIDSSRVIEICRNLSEENLMATSYRRVIAEVALSSADFDAARTYLEHLSESEPLKSHYFWPLLARANSAEEIIGILTHDMTLIKQSAYSPQHETFRDWVWPRVAPTEVSDLMTRCKSVGYTYFLLLSSYVEHLIAEKKLEEALQILQDEKLSNVRLQGGLLTRQIMISFAESKDANSTVQILNQVVRRSEKTDPPTDWIGKFLFNLAAYETPQQFSDDVNILVPHLVKSSLKTSRSTVQNICERFQVSPKVFELLSVIAVDELDNVSDDEIETESSYRSFFRLTTEEIESCLSDLRDNSQEKMNALSQLFSKYTAKIRRSNLADEEKQQIGNRVHELYALISNSRQLTPAVKSRYMDFCATVDGNLEKAKKLRQELRREHPEFVIDFRKLLDLSALLVQNGSLAEARAILNEELESRSQLKRNEEEDEDSTKGDHNLSVSVDRNDIDRAANRLINSVIEATSGDASQTKDWIDFVSRLTGLRPGPMWLSPLIRYSVSKGDIDRAMEEFDEAYRSYRMTPFKGELMKLLVEQADAKRLQKVIDASNTLYGELFTMLDLMVACVEAGKLKQARKVLETPGMRARNDRLEQICERFVAQDREDNLVNLISICQNLFDVDLDRMYYQLIRLYSYQKDAQKALNVWTTMQEQDVQPSERSLRFLAQVLQESGLPVPFQIPTQSEARKSAPQPVENRTTRMNSLKKDFDKSIQKSDLEGALKIKRELERMSDGLSLSQHSMLVEHLLKADRLNEAYSLSLSLIQERFFPTPRVIRFLLSRLSAAGEIDKLTKIAAVLPQNFKENGAYSSFVCNAYVNANREDEFLDSVLPTLPSLPVGGFLAILHKSPALEDKVRAIADKELTTKDNHMPLNMVWIYLMQKGRLDEAEALFASNEKLHSKVMFHSILKTIRDESNIPLAKSLVRQLQTSSLTPRALALSYTAFIDVLTDSGQLEEAESFVVSNVAQGERSASPGKVTFQDMNRRSLLRLQSLFSTRLGRQAAFSVPEFTPSDPENASSTSDPARDDLDADLQHLENVNVKA